MTPGAQRIAIAEACGWKWGEASGFSWIQNTKINFYKEFREGVLDAHLARELPDYLNDLNAMHEAEKTLKEHDCEIYMDKLTETSGGDTESGKASFCGYFATAAQRAEAFLRTLGKWEDRK